MSRAASAVGQLTPMQTVLQELLVQPVKDKSELESQNGRVKTFVEAIARGGNRSNYISFLFGISSWPVNTSSWPVAVMENVFSSVEMLNENFQAKIVLWLQCSPCALKCYIDSLIATKFDCRSTMLGHAFEPVITALNIPKASGDFQAISAQVAKYPQLSHLISKMLYLYCQIEKEQQDTKTALLDYILRLIRHGVSPFDLSTPNSVREQVRKKTEASCKELASYGYSSYSYPYPFYLIATETLVRDYYYPVPAVLECLYRLADQTESELILKAYLEFLRQTFDTNLDSEKVVVIRARVKQTRSILSWVGMNAGSEVKKTAPQVSSSEDTALKKTLFATAPYVTPRIFNAELYFDAHTLYSFCLDVLKLNRSNSVFQTLAQFSIDVDSLLRSVEEKLRTVSNALMINCESAASTAKQEEKQEFLKICQAFFLEKLVYSTIFFHKLNMIQPRELPPQLNEAFSVLWSISTNIEKSLVTHQRMSWLLSLFSWHLNLKCETRADLQVAQAAIQAELQAIQVLAEKFRKEWSDKKTENQKNDPIVTAKINVSEAGLAFLKFRERVLQNDRQDAGRVLLNAFFQALLMIQFLYCLEQNPQYMDRTNLGFLQKIGFLQKFVQSETDKLVGELLSRFNLEALRKMLTPFADLPVMTSDVVQAVGGQPKDASFAPVIGIVIGDIACNKLIDVAAAAAASASASASQVALPVIAHTTYQGVYRLFGIDRAANKTNTGNVRAMIKS